MKIVALFLAGCTIAYFVPAANGIDDHWDSSEIDEEPRPLRVRRDVAEGEEAGEAAPAETPGDQPPADADSGKVDAATQTDAQIGNEDSQVPADAPQQEQPQPEPKPEPAPQGILARLTRVVKTVTYHIRRKYYWLPMP